MEKYQTCGHTSSGIESADLEATAAALADFSKSIYRNAWDAIFPEDKGTAPPLCGGVAPLGFIDSPQSSTRYYKPSKQAAERRFLSRFKSVEEYDEWRRSFDAYIEGGEPYTPTPHPSAYLIRSNSKRAVYRLDHFPSGELTGNLIITGREGKVVPKPRTGPVETHSLSNSGKTKIRRAIECAADRLGYFVTLTFAPALSKLNADGTVNHVWAKKELHRFLDALTKMQIRRGRSFDYLWVSELQKNGNIHFHLLWTQFFPIRWLSKLWKQANNSVDVKALKNVHHAKRYVMKYISKSENQTIRGNRYAISSGLRIQMQAMTYMVDNVGLRREITSIVGTITHDIKAAGGFVNEWGFSLPMPERPRRTPRGTYPGVPRTLAPSLLDLLLGEVPF